jgi:signal transduction histidine kinase
MPTVGQTILIIDDEFHLLIGIKALLEREGYKTITSNDSMSGVQMAKEYTPDLIICDVMMPFMDGFKVREALNEDPATKNIPFLFLSARVDQTDKVRGLNTGADDYITKPFDHRELMARISSVLNRYEKGREDMRQKMDDEITRIQREISQNISHELRTPLTQILLALDLVLRNKYSNPEDLKEFVEIALSQSHRLNSIIDDLIFINNYDRGAVNILRQTVNITNDFQEPIRIRQNLYAEKNIQMQVRIAPNVTIHAPRREFRQAVAHLVDNALKFTTPMTNVLIDLEAQGVGGFALTVADYGMGIPEQYREKVFNPYFQISQGDRRNYNGLGVGLTIARNVARSLGGDTVILPSSSGCRVRMSVPPGALDIS